VNLRSSQAVRPKAEGREGLIANLDASRSVKGSQSERLPYMTNPDVHSSKTTAEALLGCIKRTHEAYEKALPENRRSVLLVSSSGVSIRVDRFQWINPATIISIQDAHDEGEALQVIIQHVSQLNVVLTSEEIIKTEELRKTIGFGPAS